MKKILPIIAVIAAVTAIISLYQILSLLYTGAREQNAFDALKAGVVQQRENAAVQEAGTVQSAPDRPADPADPESIAEISAEPVILPEYAPICEQNSDFFGWLFIEDTPIDYPVMYTPDDPEYYLHRGFDREYAGSGTPFLDGACYEGCGNYIIYGHHMRNGTMFASLPQYAQKEFWEAHRVIRFDTPYSYGEYEVIAAFYGKALTKEEKGFRYYQYTDLTDPAVFQDYLTQVKKAALYDTGITAEYGDELITLSTCSYYTDDGRFAVVARRIENNG